MTAPGWYPDPQDPASLQYFDGQQWTGTRQPADGYQFTAAPTITEEYEPYDSPARPWPPARHRAEPSRRRLAVIGLSAAIIAAVLTSGWFLLHRDKPARFTFAGKPVDQPGATLSRAEKALDVIVAKRHGVKSAATRCYFALPSDPPKGTRKSDVGNAVLCGPVLFVDGNAGKSYLSFPLTSTPAAHGASSLTPGSTPVSADPATLPDGFTLTRPDGRGVPTNADLAVPQPPAAAPNALLAANLPGQRLPVAPPDAMMVSLRGGIRLARVGVIPRFGSGDDARIAPAGQRLVAFTYSSVPGQIGDINPSRRQLTVSVNHAPGRQVPPTVSGQVVVAAVPATGSADLVLDADGVRQTLALPTGAPGSANLAVLRRDHIDATLSISRPMTVRFNRAGTVSQLAGKVTVTRALIGYWTDDGQHHASDGRHALLWMDVRFHIPNQADQTGVDAPLLKLTPAGGAPVQARDLDRSDRVFAAFEVPAGFTTGTVTISGTESGNPAVSIVKPVTFTVTIPG